MFFREKTKATITTTQKTLEGTHMRRAVKLIEL